MNLLTDKYFIRFVIKFLLVFFILYYGTVAFIGLAIAGNHYSSFIDHYFAYYRLLRDSLMIAVKLVLSVAGFTVDIETPNYLTLRGGRFVIISYDCLGYGVMSFWTAFVVANAGSWYLKCRWIGMGCFALWCINVARISIFLISINKKRPMLFGWSHHTWFNIIAYGFIFLMIYLYDKKSKLFS